MFRSILNIATVILALASIGCSQQVAPELTPQPPPPPPPPPTKRVGEAEVLYSAQTDRRSAKIYVYILGTSPEVPKRDKEVITMEMGYSVHGRKPVMPGGVYLRLVSYSPEVPKYADNHDLTIAVDGKVLISGEGFDWYADDGPRPTESESYGVEKINFSDFEKMSMAKSLSIQLGITKIDITGEALSAIRDLLKTVEK